MLRHYILFKEMLSLQVFTIVELTITMNGP